MHFRRSCQRIVEPSISVWPFTSTNVWMQPFQNRVVACLDAHADCNWLLEALLGRVLFRNGQAVAVQIGAS